MKKLGIILSAVGALLLIPLVAMQFTDEVNWTIFDFLIAFVLLTGTASLVVFGVGRIENKMLRIVVSSAVVLLLLVVWAELAVGIFG